MLSGKTTPIKLPDNDALLQTKIDERDRRQQVFNSTQYKLLLERVLARLSDPAILDKYFMGCPKETFQDYFSSIQCRFSGSRVQNQKGK